MDEALQQLLDKRALDELIARQMHAMDSCDWPTYRRGVLDDAEFDFTDHGVATDAAAEVMKGGDYFVATLKSVIEGFDATQHCITNILHELDGATAKTRCYVYAEHYIAYNRGDPTVTCGARYEIDSRKTAEGWKIARLKFVTLWFRGNTHLYKLAAEVAPKRAKRW